MDTEILRQIFKLEERVKELEDERDLRIYDMETGLDLKISPCELASEMWTHFKDKDIHIAKKPKK